jgi:hypothetical protein
VDLKNKLKSRKKSTKRDQKLKKRDRKSRKRDRKLLGVGGKAQAIGGRRGEASLHQSMNLTKSEVGRFGAIAGAENGPSI